MAGLPEKRIQKELCRSLHPARTQQPPVITREDILSFVTPYQAVPADKNIIVIKKTLTYAQFGEADGSLPGIINGIVVDQAIMELARIARTVPDIDASPGIGYRPIVLADIVTDNIVMPGTGAKILEQAITAA